MYQAEEKDHPLYPEKEPPSRPSSSGASSPSERAGTNPIGSPSNRSNTPEAHGSTCDESARDPRRFGPHIERRPLVKELELPLAEAAVAKRAHEAAELSKLIDDLEDEKAFRVKEFNEQLSDWRAKLSDMMKSIREGKERKIVPCVEVKDFAAFAIRYEVEGVIVEERAMTREECQLEMPLKPEIPEALRDDEGRAA
jgi:hypothetical protein